MYSIWKLQVNCAEQPCCSAFYSLYKRSIIRPRLYAEPAMPSLPAMPFLNNIIILLNTKSYFTIQHMSTINITLHNTDNSTRVLKHSRLIAGLQSHFPGFIPYNTKTQLFKDKEHMGTVHRKCTNSTLHLF